MLHTELDRNTQSFKGKNLQYEKDNLPSCRVETMKVSEKIVLAMDAISHRLWGD